MKKKIIFLMLLAPCISFSQTIDYNIVCEDSSMVRKIHKFESDSSYAFAVISDFNVSDNVISFYIWKGYSNLYERHDQIVKNTNRRIVFGDHNIPAIFLLDIDLAYVYVRKGGYLVRIPTDIIIEGLPYKCYYH